MTRVLVYGAGGHGKIVADVVRSAGHEVAGFIDANPALHGRVVEPGGGRVVLSDTELAIAMQTGAGLPCAATAVVVAVGDNVVRLRLLEKLGDLVAEPLVHSSAVVSTYARLGRGAVVCPRAVINSDAVLGTGVIVNTGAIVEHDCVVGDGAHLSPAVTLCGGVRVGARTWIGAGAVVIPGITIGGDAIVGAGSVVLHDVASGTTVLGVPARMRPAR